MVCFCTTITCRRCQLQPQTVYYKVEYVYVNFKLFEFNCLTPSYKYYTAMTEPAFTVKATKQISSTSLIVAILVTDDTKLLQ